MGGGAACTVLEPGLGGRFGAASTPLGLASGVEGLGAGCIV